jgi:hypothetical protein
MLKLVTQTSDSASLFSAATLLDEEYYTFINPQIFAGSPGDPQIFRLARPHNVLMLQGCFLAFSP